MKSGHTHTCKLDHNAAERHKELCNCYVFCIYFSSLAKISIYWSLCVSVRLSVRLSLTADVFHPFPPGAVCEEVYPGNSGQRSLPVWQVCDGGLTAAVLLSLSLSVFLSPVSPSFEPAAAESSSVCSYVTAAACRFMEHKRLRFDPGYISTYTCTHTPRQLQHVCPFCS